MIQRASQSALQGLGGLLLDLVGGIGGALFFGVQALRFGVIGLFKRKVYNRNELIRQVEMTGTRSLVIMVLVAGLIGLTMVAQMAPTIAEYGPADVVAVIVGVSILRTLGPVLTAIVYSGRVGAAFTAELGTMKVSDELMALEAMGIPPIAYLAAPRVMVSMAMLVSLTVVFDLVALVAAYALATSQFGITSESYLDLTRRFVDFWDFLYGLIKAGVFAVLISVISCYKGFNVRGGGQDVGRATMESVVTCLLAVIFADFVLSLLYNVLVSAGWYPAY